MNAAKTKPNAKRNERRAVVSAQQTIPYVAMHPDGVCQLPGGLYTKTVEYEDINYAVASTEDQTAIFGGWSSFLNYFDSSLPFQLSFVNRRSRSANRYKVNIPEQEPGPGQAVHSSSWSCASSILSTTRAATPSKIEFKSVL